MWYLSPRSEHIPGVGFVDMKTRIGMVRVGTLLRKRPLSFPTAVTRGNGQASVPWPRSQSLCTPCMSIAHVHRGRTHPVYKNEVVMF